MSKRPSPGYTSLCEVSAPRTLSLRPLNSLHSQQQPQKRAESALLLPPDYCAKKKAAYYSNVNFYHHLITKRSPESLDASDSVDKQDPKDSAAEMLKCFITPAFSNVPGRCSKSRPHHVTLEVIVALVMEALNRLLPSSLKSVEERKAIEIARLIKFAMEGPHRFFHSSGHAVKLASFNGGKFDSPAVTLAALFHDVVYMQIDGRINSTCEEYIPKGVVEVWENSRTGEWRGRLLVDLEELESATDYVSKALVATCIIFGVSTNSELSNKNGLNEFLSALTAIYALSPVVQSLGVLVEIALIIEATIPFRSKDRETGLTVGETLRKRLNKVCNLFTELSNWDDEACKDAVERAIFLGDKDVGSFIQEVDEFLSDTFEQLLPETNSALRDRDSLTCRQYRIAINRMHQFFCFLENATIFQRYASFPSEEEFQRIEKKSRQNVRIGKAYLGLKLISTELLGALADLHLSEGGSCRQGQHQQKRKREREDGDDTYGSIPLVVLLGDIDKQNSSDVDHLHYASEENFADDKKADSTSNTTNSVFHTDILEDLKELLIKGLAWSAGFDLKKPTLELKIFCSIPAAELETLLSNLKSLWQTGEASPREILQQFPKELVRQVIQMQISLQNNFLSFPEEKFREKRMKLVASLEQYKKKDLLY